MCTYLKNIGGWKPKDLKNKSFANIQELFDKAMKRVNTFVDFRTELVEGTEIEESSKKAKVMEESSKRAGDELEQESTKKQKMDEDKETTELQSLMKIVPNEEEVATDAIPLATKPLTIVDYKIIKEGKISFFQIITVDGSLKRYSAFIQMLKSFDREDLETLWKLVKAKHGYTRPERGYERVLWGDLKIIVHFVRFQDMRIFMLVKKRYPLTPATITDMLNRKLQADHLNEIGIQQEVSYSYDQQTVRIKRLLVNLGVTAVKVRVTAAKKNLLRNSRSIEVRFNKKYPTPGINNWYQSHVARDLGFYKKVQQVVDIKGFKTEEVVAVWWHGMEQDVEDFIVLKKYQQVQRKS
ncbi:hypothetical protein Tco_1131911 [Tanacetum coccineum]|uniref:Reverse transcriptase n=1 Tax=Tanacetum coccineum TaxID=301880 RepID=A0ABQ5JC51_9ASTR